MLRFYLWLWLFWLYKTLRFALVGGILFAALVTFWLYMQSGFTSLNQERVFALADIFGFWFGLFFHLAFVFALFFSSRYLFQHCFAKRALHLSACKEQTQTQKIERQNLLRVSRRLLFLIIWISAALTVVLFSGLYLLGVCSAFFSCFNVVVLDFLVLISGFFAIVLLSHRCKYVEMKVC